MAQQSRLAVGRTPACAAQRPRPTAINTAVQPDRSAQTTRKQQNSVSERPLQQQQQQQRRQRQLEQQQRRRQRQPSAAPPPQQQQQQQQQQKYAQKEGEGDQQSKPIWGYLVGDSVDQWTWDDDYNPGAKARAKAAAQALPPTPREAAAAAQEAAVAQQQPTVITRLPEHFSSQVLANAVVLVDKPPRWSSADVVRELKRLLRVQHVGHGGPLDAQAGGLLIVLMGAATRLTPKLEALPRTYTGSIRLGISTDTYDASGQPLSSGPWAHLSDMDITAAAASFTGEVLQVPCMWSSSKFNSRPLRWYAQRGQTVARPPRAVTIESLSVWRDPTTPAAGVGISSGSGSATQQQQQRRQQQPQQQVDPQQQQQVDPQQQQQQQQKQSDLVHFRAVASRGASMRVLADDLGRALGCGAHLAALRREAIGGFSVETAWRLDVLLPMAQKYAKGFRNTPALPP